MTSRNGSGDDDTALSHGGESQDNTLALPPDRKRSKQFITAENDILVEEVIHNYQFLYGRNTLYSTESKESVWRRIAESVSAVGVARRTAEVCRKRWADCKMTVKKKLSKQYQHSRTTGGGPPLAIQFLPWETKIMEHLQPESVSGIPAGMDTGFPLTMEISSAATVPGPSTAPSVAVPIERHVEQHVQQSNHHKHRSSYNASGHRERRKHSYDHHKHSRNEYALSKTRRHQQEREKRHRKFKSHQSHRHERPLSVPAPLHPSSRSTLSAIGDGQSAQQHTVYLPHTENINTSGHPMPSSVNEKESLELFSLPTQGQKENIRMSLTQTTPCEDEADAGQTTLASCDNVEDIVDNATVTLFFVPEDDTIRPSIVMVNKEVQTDESNITITLNNLQTVMLSMYDGLQRSHQELITEIKKMSSDISYHLKRSEK